jgi:hypothetical protein
MEALQNGRGFINVKGIPVSHNAAGDILGHVRETAADPSDSWSVSGSQHMTSGRMAMPLFKWVQQDIPARTGVASDTDDIARADEQDAG